MTRGEVGNVLSAIGHLQSPKFLARTNSEGPGVLRGLCDFELWLSFPKGICGCLCFYSSPFQFFEEGEIDSLYRVCVLDGHANVVLKHEIH